MNPIDFLKTIYVGDRACKKIILDTWNNEIKIQVCNISRVRGASWNFYDKEDLVDGYLIIENVKKFDMKPMGFFPNDYINEISIKKNFNDSCYSVYINISSIDINGIQTEVELFVEASNICLLSKEDSINKIRN